MSHYNFKHRDFFDFNSHLFNVGNPIGKWHGYEDNHFILKILRLKEDKYPTYYQHHADDYVKENKGTAEKFFMLVWKLVQNRIDGLERKDPHSSDHPDDVIKINKLNAFHKFMVSIDEWNARPASVINAEMEKTILRQKAQIAKLEEKLQALSEYEVKEKIHVEENHLPTLIDIIWKIAKLKLPNQRLLLRSQHLSVYYKIIAKYFNHGGKDIPLQTVKNYFNGLTITDKPKTTIPADKELYEIIPKDNHTTTVRKR